MKNLILKYYSKPY